MRKIPAMVSMRRTPAEKTDAAEVMADGPDYPWGLCISLCNDDLEKLGLDDSVAVGDMLHIHAMAKVTSVSSSDNESSGPDRRVELQITDMVGEDEDAEDDDTDRMMTATKAKKALYG